MAGRIRTIKPELLEDETAASLGNVAWRIWVSSFLLADDYGNLRASPNWILGQIFWGRDDVDTFRVTLAIEELTTCKGGEGLWKLYWVRGQAYANITGWQKHQRVDKPGKPRCPGPEMADNSRPCENSRDSRESSREHSGESRESLANIPGSLAPDPDLRPVPTTPTPTIDPDQAPVARPEREPDQGIEPVRLGPVDGDDKKIKSPWKPGDPIAGAADLEAFVAAQGWNVTGISSSNRGRAHALIKAGPISPEETREALDRFGVVVPARPVGYWLSCVEAARKEFEAEAARQTAPPRKPRDYTDDERRLIEEGMKHAKW